MIIKSNTAVELPNKELRCPECNEKNDGATATEGKKEYPEPGNFSICWYCGNIGVYEEGLTIRKASTFELQEIKRNAPKTFNEMTFLSMALAKKRKR